MPTILLVRHAQGSFGQGDYDRLSELGVTQAAALAQDLARRGVAVDRVVSGSLARQRDTAAPIAAAARRETAVDPRWNEYDADDILAAHSDTAVRLSRPAGRPVSPREFQDALDGALAAWLGAGANTPARESWPAFAGRVGSALAELAAGLAQGETAVVVTSGGVLAAVCVATLGLPDPTLLAFNRVAVNSGVTKLARGRRGTTLVAFNDHSHLERPGASLITYR